MWFSKFILNRASMAGSVLLTGLALSTGVAIAGFPFPCDYYQQKAVESENMANQESSVQIQQTYHQAAAALYREAANKYRAEHQKCVRQSPDSSAIKPQGSGAGQFAPQQENSPVFQDQAAPDSENERRRAQKRQAVQRTQPSSDLVQGTAGESIVSPPEAEAEVEWKTDDSPAARPAAAGQQEFISSQTTQADSSADAANSPSPWGAEPPAQNGQRFGQEIAPAPGAATEPSREPAATESAVVSWGAAGETAGEPQAAGQMTGSPPSGQVSSNGVSATSGSSLLDISKVDDAASVFNIPQQATPTTYAESGMKKLNVSEYLSTEKIDAWYDRNAKPLVDTAVDTFRRHGSEYASAVVDQVIAGEDVDLKEAVKTSLSERVDRLKEAARDAIEGKALDLYFNYAARAKYGKPYSELDDADKLDIYTNKAAANMVFTPVRALLTRNIEGAGDAHGTETEYILNQAEKVMNP